VIPVAHGTKLEVSLVLSATLKRFPWVLEYFKNRHIWPPTNGKWETEAFTVKK